MSKPKDFSISTPLGHQIGVSIFYPNLSNNKSLIISSATGVLQRFYFQFASHFCELGYTVYTFDYSGIGKSCSNIKNLKHSKIDLETWGENDQASIIDYAKTENSNHQIVLITHSIGGQIIAFNKHINLVDIIITVASQSGYWKHWKGFERFKMFSFWNVLIPILTSTFGYFPAKKFRLFENLPKRMVYQWRRWGNHKDYMLSEFNVEDLEFKNFNKNMLVLSFSNDEYASKASVDWLANQFGHATIDRRHIIPEELSIPNVGHFGFFKERYKSSLWETTHTWIENHL